MQRRRGKRTRESQTTPKIKLHCAHHVQVDGLALLADEKHGIREDVGELVSELLRQLRGGSKAKKVGS